MSSIGTSRIASQRYTPYPYRAHFRATYTSCGGSAVLQITLIGLKPRILCNQRYYWLYYKRESTHGGGWLSPKATAPNHQRKTKASTHYQRKIIEILS